MTDSTDTTDDETPPPVESTFARIRREAEDRRTRDAVHGASSRTRFAQLAAGQDAIGARLVARVRGAGNV